jgi:hypothetical protein
MQAGPLEADVATEKYTLLGPGGANGGAEQRIPWPGHGRGGWPRLSIRTRCRICLARTPDPVPSQPALGGGHRPVG